MTSNARNTPARWKGPWRCVELQSRTGQADWVLIAALGAIFITIGFVAGGMAVASQSPGSAAGIHEEPASVSCITFLEEGGEPSGMCFVSGDVDFEWIGEDDIGFYGNRSTTNGTVSLEDLPMDNSTVRRRP